jgi:hypothetical protein
LVRPVSRPDNLVKLLCGKKPLPQVVRAWSRHGSGKVARAIVEKWTCEVS